MAKIVKMYAKIVKAICCSLIYYSKSLQTDQIAISQKLAQRLINSSPQAKSSGLFFLLTLQVKSVFFTKKGRRRAEGEGRRRWGCRKGTNTFLSHPYRKSLLNPWLDQLTWYIYTVIFHITIKMTGK